MREHVFQGKNVFPEKKLIEQGRVRQNWTQKKNLGCVLFRIISQQLLCFECDSKKYCFESHSKRSGQYRSTNNLFFIFI